MVSGVTLTVEPILFAKGVLIDTVDLHIKGERIDVTLPARLFLNFQQPRSIWAEVTPQIPWLNQMEVEISSSALSAFPAVLSGYKWTQTEGRTVSAAGVLPLRDPIESSSSIELRQITLALLDSPTVDNVVRPQLPRSVTLPCGQFDITIAEASNSHRQIAESLGSGTHQLTNSCLIVQRNGQPFSVTAGTVVLDTLHDALSIAAGRWVGITLVEATGIDGATRWLRWGTGKMSDGSPERNWFDAGHPEWMTKLCDALLSLRTDDESKDVLQKVLYWYVRSNGNAAGVDSSLILSQCALELLSWFVIVKRKAALTEVGYGQLSDAAERLRLTLALLDIPAHIPSTLKNIKANKNWKDIADAIVQGRNYLVHPTQSRKGKLRSKQDYPWYELRLAAQWILELIILRILGYSGKYCNRTRLKDFDAVEDVPWS
jgi:hypothetical protein